MSSRSDLRQPRQSGIVMCKHRFTVYIFCEEMRVKSKHISISTFLLINSHFCGARGVQYIYLRGHSPPLGRSCPLNIFIEGGHVVHPLHHWDTLPPEVSSVYLYCLRLCSRCLETFDKQLFSSPAPLEFVSGLQSAPNPHLFKKNLES